MTDAQQQKARTLLAAQHSVPTMTESLTPSLSELVLNSNIAVSQANVSPENMRLMQELLTANPSPDYFLESEDIE